MTELWLKFKDDNGEDRRVAVGDERFAVGRHSSNDLCIPNSKLSREHIRIERFGEVFVVSDCGSSNGTTINDKKLSDPVPLNNGDQLNLGGGVEVEVEITSNDPNAFAQPEEAAADQEAGGGFDAEDELGGPAGEAGAGAGGTASAHDSSSSGGIPTSIFYVAPVLGVMILLLLGGLVYFASNGDGKKPGNDDDFVYTANHDRDTPSKDRDVPSGNNTKTSTTPDDPPPSNSGQSNTGSGDPTSSPSTVNLSDSAKCEKSGAAFLREIAQNDPKAFLTGEQAQIINAKIKQISSSSAIADNINSARRSSSQIKSLAASKNLKPQLLAVAALTKLGTSKGDPLQAAKDMADTLDKLGTQIGSELANDSLMMIAAYDQGAGGDFMKLRNLLQDVATKSTESSREIRTIWFLHKNGKITDSEYNFALQFLAIGIITQNPKDFGVNTEALVL